MVADPWLDRWREDVSKVLASEPPAMPWPRTPRDAIGHQRLLAEYAQSGSLGAEGTDLARALRAAVPVLWAAPMVALALTADLPRHVVSNVALPHRSMLWMFDAPHGISPPGRTGAVVEAVLVVGAANGAHAWFLTFGPTFGVTGISIRRGEQYPATTQSGARVVLPMVDFLNSKYVALERRRTHEQGVKAKHHGRRVGDPLAISVVTLRAEATGGAETEHREGRHVTVRSLVRAHWKMQPHPSAGTREPLFIASHLRGPKDAPIKQRVYEVVR